jgi:ABC-type lipoprotein export system ATPase subunit
MKTNDELLKALKGTPRARFYLCDLHVHSPASLDIRDGERFDLLSETEKILLSNIGYNRSKDPLQYEEEILKAFPIEAYYKLLIERRDEVSSQESIPEGEDWAYVAITDHKICGYAASLSKYAWENRAKERMVILPGIELDVLFPIENGEKTIAHIILIFSPGTQSSDIRIAIHPQTTNNWTFGQTAEVTELPKFISSLRTHPNYPAIAIAAHVSSSKGVRESVISKHKTIERFTALDAAIARTMGEIENFSDADKESLKSRLQQLNIERDHEVDNISLEVLKLIGSCGFDALQVSCKKDEIHYRRLHRFRDPDGRAIPLIASDAHRIKDIFSCEENVPYLKLPIQSIATSPNQCLFDLRRAIRYGETRFSYRTPGQVMSWISGLEIFPDAQNASSFWPFKTENSNKSSFLLPLSRNLNCLVGGRGSGKSAVIEALAFITQPEDFGSKYRKKDEELEDWYKRARATLEGCQVRLVWQSIGKTADLPKGALFGTRYFNPTGQHPPVSYTNLENKEILGSSLSLESTQLFRARDIENAADPYRLRQLFDDLVGEQIFLIERDINETLDLLSSQRKEMSSIARQIMMLTQDDMPLREYVRRKTAYESVNRPSVQPFYRRIDEINAAELIAIDLDNRWSQAQGNAEIENGRLKFLGILDILAKKIRDENDKIKPYCDGMAKLVEKDNEGLSVRERLEHAFNEVQVQLDEIKDVISYELSQIKAEHKDARETLTKAGLPPGAKDREAKKINFEESEQDLVKYRELLERWRKMFDIRNSLFEDLVVKCKKRTDLRTETAKRICSYLDRDLDPSVIVIKIQVHPMEDQSLFRDWLTKNVGPCISKLKESRITAIIDKGVMPKDVRDSMLGELQDCSSIFIVERDKASEGRVEKDLATTISQRCSGKIRLEPEHKGMKEIPSCEFVDNLPLEIQEGLWTFPESNETSSNKMKLDEVLALDEIVFNDRPEILLNDRPQEFGSKPRPIGELSNGQRCSAILPILLLNGQGPLIIDQPEDNLDNRLIRQVIVNILASIKLRRQVIIATHNPNLPILGDVEQAIVLRAVEEKQAILESVGDLDSPITVTHLTEIMEGGREAFQYRQSIYQAHWAGPVEVSALKAVMRKGAALDS